MSLYSLYYTLMASMWRFQGLYRFSLASTIPLLAILWWPLLSLWWPLLYSVQACSSWPGISSFAFYKHYLTSRLLQSTHSHRSQLLLIFSWPIVSLTQPLLALSPSSITLLYWYSHYNNLKASIGTLMASTCSLTARSWTLTAYITAYLSWTLKNSSGLFSILTVSTCTLMPLRAHSWPLKALSTPCYSTFITYRA